MSLDEKIIATEHIFKGRVVDLRVHSVKMPDDSVFPRELIHHPGAVAVVPFDEDGNVILVRQYRHGAGKPLLELPAGGLMPGEDPVKAARRELQEEIGYDPQALVELGFYYVAAAYTTEAIRIYIGRDLQPSELAGDVDEFIEVERVPFDEALAMALRNEIEDAKTLIGLMWAAHHREA